MKPNYCPQNTGATYCKTRLIRGNVKPRFQSWGQLTKKKCKLTGEYNITKTIYSQFDCKLEISKLGDIWSTFVRLSEMSPTLSVVLLCPAVL